MANKVTYGPGAKGAFTCESFLEAAGISEYAEMAGNGLSIGGLNMGTADRAFRIPEGTETLTVIAPEMDLVEVELEFNPAERTAEEEAEVMANRAGTTENTEEAPAEE